MPARTDAPVAWLPFSAMAVMATTGEGRDERAQPLATNLSWLLGQASHALLTEMTAGLESLGVSPRAYHVMSLALTGEFTQIELAQTVGLDKTTMGVLVDELEAAGLAERLPSSTDRRARVVSVTEAGMAKVAEAEDVFEAVQRDVLAALPARQRQPFIDALAHLVGARLSKPSACAKPPRRRAPKP